MMRFRPLLLSVLLLGVLIIPAHVHACPPPDSVPCSQAGCPETRDMELTYELEPIEYVCLDSTNIWWKAWETIHLTWQGDWCYDYSFNQIKVGEIFEEGGEYKQQTTTTPGWFETKTLFRFDAGPEAVPGMKEFLKAELVLAPNSTTAIGNVGVYRALNTWTLDVNFSDSKQDSEYPGPIAMDRENPYDLHQPTQELQRYRWDITSLYRGWMEGSIPNQGCFLALDNPRPEGAAPPASGEPKSTVANMGYELQEDEGLPGTPCLLITYMGNGPPVASIDEVSPAEPTDDDTINIKGSGLDPDGNDIDLWRWKVNGDVVDEGPGKSTLQIELAMGLYDVELMVRDNDVDYPRWSDPASVKVFVDHQSDEAPTVLSLTASSGGNEGTSFPQDSTVVFSVSEKIQRTGLEGSITIIGGSNVWVGAEPLKDAGDGTYTYSWSTAGMAAGTYAVDVILRDPATGLEDANGLKSGVDLEIFLTDVIPPDLEKVRIGGQTSTESVQPGTEVEIQVLEASRDATCTGTVDIKGPQELLNRPLQNSGIGLYTVTWDTEGFTPGLFDIYVTLKDQFDNERVSDIPDLSVLLEDTLPPRILSVMTEEEGDSVFISVRVVEEEEGLTAIAYLYGPETLEERMTDEGSGLYTLEIDKTVLEPGVYDVDLTMIDASDNFEIAQTIFTVDSEIPPPMIVGYSPEDGEEITDTSVDIVLLFSKPVTISDEGRDLAIQVWDGSGETVPGTVTFKTDRKEAVFTAKNGYSRGVTYTVSVSPYFIDDEGTPLSQQVSWNFKVLRNDPPVFDNSQPGQETVIKSGNTQTFSVNVTGMESVEWFVGKALANGSRDLSKEGDGTTFTFEPQEANVYLVRCVADGPGGNVSRYWMVTVETVEEEEEADGKETVNDSSSGTGTTAAAAGIAIVATVLLIIPLLLMVKGRQEGPAKKNNEVEKKSQASLKKPQSSPPQAPVMNRAQIPQNQGPPPRVKKGGY